MEQKTELDKTTGSLMLYMIGLLDYMTINVAILDLAAPIFLLFKRCTTYLRTLFTSPPYADCMISEPLTKFHWDEMTLAPMANT